MSIEQQRIEALNLLSLLKEIDPSCILAGGAPRNWLDGREAKDLDFYIHLNCRHLGYDRTKKRIEQVLGFPITLANTTEQLYELAAPPIELAWVFNLNIEGETPVQIMVCNRPTFDVTRSFNNTISRCWTSNGRDLREDAVAAASRAVKMILYKEQEEGSKGARYQDKIRGYYPYYESLPWTAETEQLLMRRWREARATI